MSKWVGANLVRALMVLFLAAVASLPGTPLQAVDEPDACELDGRATGPCIISNVSLTSGPLARTLPFEVPVFIQGKVKGDVESIVLHIFAAPEPFRVEERKCSGDPSKECFVCLLQEPTRQTLPAKQKEWPRAVLTGASEGNAECSLSIRASTWNHQPSPLPVPAAGSPGGGAAAARPDVDYVLRIPPLPANRYFVLLVELESQLDSTQTARVWKWVEPGLDKVLQTADKNAQSTELHKWLAQIHVDACREMKAMEREEDIELRSRRPGSLFDCGTDKQADPDLTQTMDQLVGYYSAEVEPRVNFEGCGKEWISLRDALAALGDEQLAAVSPRRLKAEAQCPATVLARGGWTEGALEDPCAASNPCETDRIATVVEGYSSLLARLAKLVETTQDPALKAKLIHARGRADTLQGYAAQVAGGPQAQREARQKMLQEIDARLREVVLVDASTLGNFLTRQRGYLGADFGFAYVYDVEQAVPYMGTNIYLVPVNKNAPLLFNQWSGTWSKRFAFSLGVTMQQFDDPQSKSLFSTFNLLTGVGIRVTESIRLTGGAAWFRKKDEDLLGNNRDKVNFSPYLSLSLDWDVRSLINWVTKIFGSS